MRRKTFQAAGRAQLTSYKIMLMLRYHQDFIRGMAQNIIMWKTFQRGRASSHSLNSSNSRIKLFGKRRIKEGQSSIKN
jgi:hypothetical protein